MSLHDPRPATYADIEALPENMVGEILFGDLVTHPRPARRAIGAGSVLGGILGHAFHYGPGGPGGWMILDEPELHLGPHVVVPDLAGWRRDMLVGREEGPWFEEVPDWACEILSPSTEYYDRGIKRRIYATHGVGHLWHLDPRTRLLEVFVRQDSNWLLTHTFSERDEVRAPPFDAISFSMGLLWTFDPPPAPRNAEEA